MNMPKHIARKARSRMGSMRSEAGAAAAGWAGNVMADACAIARPRRLISVPLRSARAAAAVIGDPSPWY